MTLKNKRVLLLAPKFFNYEVYLAEALRAKGADVAYYNADPSQLITMCDSTLKKIIKGSDLFVKLFEKRLQRRITGKYDYIIIVCGWAVTRYTVKYLRDFRLKQNGKMILYYWDSIDRLADDVERRKYFDLVFSFDPFDCANSKEKILHLPLFYTDTYVKQSYKNNPKYDLSIIGSFRLDRYDYIEKLKKQNPSLKIYSYLYIKKYVIRLHKLLRKKYRHIDLGKLDFSALSQEEVIEKYSNSKAVLDKPGDKQRGLTIRTFETLAMRKKLVTSNDTIKGYDFYCPNNIFVIDSNNMVLPDESWFDQPFDNSRNKIFSKYCLDNWMSVLLGETDVSDFNFIGI